MKRIYYLLIISSLLCKCKDEKNISIDSNLNVVKVYLSCNRGLDKLICISKFDSIGNIIEKTNYSYDNGKTEEILNNFYDSKNLLVKSKICSYNEKDTIYKTVKYSYKNNLLIKEAVIESSFNDSAFIYLEYYPNNKLKTYKTVTKGKYFRNGYSEYIYNNTDSLSMVYFCDLDGSNRFLFDSIVYLPNTQISYNVKGGGHKTVYYRNNLPVKLVEDDGFYEETYMYNDNKELIEIREVLDKSSLQKIKRKVYTFTYDKNNRQHVVKKIGVNEAKSLIFTNLYSN